MDDGYKHQLDIIQGIGYKDYFDYWKREIGLSPYSYGEWYENFGSMLNVVFSLENKTILDLGCAGGSTVKALSRVSPKVYGCDVNHEVIQKTPYKEVSEKLYFCDSRTLWDTFSFGFDFINSHMVFEHFPSWEYTKEVIHSIYNALNEGGIIFAALDCCEHHFELEELLAIRTSGQPVDVTHTNVWPMFKWINEFKNYGFTDVSSIFCPIVDAYTDRHLFNYFQKYKWHMFAFAKEGNYMNYIKMGTDNLNKLLEEQSTHVPKNIQKQIYSEIMDKRDVQHNIKSIFEIFI